MANERRPEDENEGEGSRTAAEGYRKGLEEHLRRGTTAEEAERAREDVERSPEEYRRAEEEGKRRSKGDLPEDVES
jgi:hypothetical protein